MSRDLEPTDSLDVIVQHIVGPSQLEHNIGIDRIGFVRLGVKAQRVLQKPGVVAALGQNSRVEGRFRSRALDQNQRHVECHSNAVGSYRIATGQNLFEQWHRG